MRQILRDCVHSLSLMKRTRNALTAKNIVLWGDIPLAKPCVKYSQCHEALIKYEEFQSSLMPLAQPRFVAAYFMNGKFYYWSTGNLAEVVDYMDVREGACRSTINAAVFVDREAEKIWCFEEDTPWKSLMKPKGDLASCRVKK
jgi:hypothetical protein